MTTCRQHGLNQRIKLNFAKSIVKTTATTATATTAATTDRNKIKNHKIGFNRESHESTRGEESKDLDRVKDPLIIILDFSFTLFVFFLLFITHFLIIIIIISFFIQDSNDLPLYYERCREFAQVPDKLGNSIYFSDGIRKIDYVLVFTKNLEGEFFILFVCLSYYITFLIFNN